MTKGIKIVSPVDGRVYAERPIATDDAIETAFRSAREAQAEWRRVGVAERGRYCLAAVAAMLAMEDEITPELAWLMGRPVSVGGGELKGFAERASHMIEIAAATLASIDPGPKPGYVRFIRREPMGVVLCVAPWNFPYMTAVNAIVPALVAGNTVILKHAAQTALVAERFRRVFDEAGLPEGVFQHLILTHQQTANIISSGLADLVCFTGSVEGGRAMEKAAAGRFMPLNLELGGKDAAYVRHDANLAFTVKELVDGAFFNSGQSCCAVERIYVSDALYDDFVDAFTEKTRSYVLDNPLQEGTTMGPMVRTEAAEHVRGQIAAALRAGGKGLIDAAQFPAAREGSPYMAPQVLVNVDHSMSVMTEESFGPVVGIMKIRDDDEAITLVNDSRYGLTASLWTEDYQAAQELGDRLEVGTVYMNRCDYLDPSLAWTGVKDSGCGCTLSQVGYEALTRPKSFHLKTMT